MAVANKLARMMWAVWHKEVDVQTPTDGAVAA